jgi:hypothetical protein
MSQTNVGSDVGESMTVGELREILASWPDEAEVVISLFKSNGTVQALPIDGVDEAYGLVHLDTSEEEGITY